MTTAPGSHKSQCAAAKREAEGIRKYPQLFHVPYLVEWVKPAGFHRAKPPYKALRAFRTKSGMPPPSLFLLTPSKGAFSFSSEKEKGGFEAAAFAALSRARNGRTPALPAQGKNPTDA